MTLVINLEFLSEELYKEVFPLAQKCWRESTEIKDKTCVFYGERDFEVEPDYKSYSELALAGNLIIVTLRSEKKDAKLLGYASGIVYRSLHHAKVVCGFGDTFYIEPEYRSYAAALLKRVEKEFSSAGVVIVGWPATIGGPVHKLLEASGYLGDDMIMEKRLCASH